MVLFEDPVEREHILNQEKWFADKHEVYVQPWKPNFNPIPLLVYSNPVWINLYNLPIEYWGESYLGKIGRALGSVLEINFDDEGELCKMVKIKVAAIKKILEYICLQTANGVWRQRLEIDKERKGCYRCDSKFHDTENCRMFLWKARRPSRNPEQMWKKKPDKKSMDMEVKVNEEIFDKNKEKSGNSLNEIAEKHANAEKGFIEENISQKEDTEYELDRESGEDLDQEDVLENVDPRCISQSTNILLGKGKGSRGRRSNRQKREDGAKEKGIGILKDAFSEDRHWCDGYIYEIILCLLVDILPSKEACVEMLEGFIREEDVEIVGGAVLKVEEEWASILGPYFNPLAFLSDKECSNPEDEVRVAAEAIRMRKEEFMVEAWEVFKVGVKNADMEPFRRMMLHEYS
ncbi:hypothetical protein SUGI_0720860 [Cryptomeria japonica]|nr:hypothetical protein SUGI_0720860 [Cryptomeria japonica]